MSPELLILVVIGLALVTASVQAQPGPAGNESRHVFERRVTIEQKLNYLLYLPKDYHPARAEGWPLLLFLHGAGERGSDLSRVKIHGPMKRAAADTSFPFILVSPQCDTGKVWEVAPLMGLLDEVVAAHHVDISRVYVTGLSMGGFGTWSLASAHPERFAAVAPICGGGQPISVYLADAEKQEQLRALPIWAFHGEKDNLVPVGESQRMVDAFKRIGGREVKLTLYPEAGHDSWTETYNNPDFFEWLLQQRLEAH